MLLLACGFLGGVLVEKGESSSTPAATAGAGGLAARLGAIRGGSGASGTGAAAGAATSSRAGGGSGGGVSRPTAGTVAYLAGGTLYVTNAEGNTVKVETSAATSITRTVDAHVSAIHPGEAVTVLGATSADGTLSAESISVGSGATGLAGLFGGRSRAGTGGSGGASSGAGPSLFGSG